MHMVEWDSYQLGSVLSAHQHLPDLPTLVSTSKEFERGAMSAGKLKNTNLRRHRAPKPYERPKVRDG